MNYFQSIFLFFYISDFIYFISTQDEKIDENFDDSTIFSEKLTNTPISPNPMTTTNFDHFPSFQFPSDSIPIWSYHHFHRNNLFTDLSDDNCFSLSKSELRKNSNFDDISINKYGSNGNYKMRKNTSSNAKNNSQKTKFNFRANRQAEFGKQIFSVHFTDLNLDFYRLHYGGGNGIELLIQNFVIVGSETRFTGKKGKTR